MLRKFFHHDKLYIFIFKYFILPLVAEMGFRRSKQPKVKGHRVYIRLKTWCSVWILQPVLIFEVFGFSSDVKTEM